jgi:hypothetical protein
VSWDEFYRCFMCLRHDRPQHSSAASFVTLSTKDSLASHYQTEGRRPGTGRTETYGPRDPVAVEYLSQAVARTKDISPG